MNEEQLIAAGVAIAGAVAARFGIRLRWYRRHVVASFVLPFVRGAITLPFPRLRAVLVVYGRPAMLRNAGYAYLRVHEWAHVDQAIDFGWREYYRMHAAWRIEHVLDDGKITIDDILAKDSPMEFFAYDRQARFIASMDDANGVVEALVGHYPPIRFDYDRRWDGGHDRLPF